MTLAEMTIQRQSAVTLTNITATWLTLLIKPIATPHQYQSNSDKLKDARLELFKSLRQMEDFLEYAEDALMQTFRINDLREGISDMLP
jgi:hypothetical protein